MKLLVTGGCGFIGSNFVNYLAPRHPEWEITVLDNLTYAGDLKNIGRGLRSSNRFRFVQGDIRDRARVEEVVHGTDVIVHFAAESHVSYSFIHADLFTDVNARGTSILCETVVKIPVKKLIHISTSEVYGDCLTAPMTEDHPLLPRNPYAGSKAAADRLAYSYYVAFNIPLVILRPFNNYGPSQHTEKVIPCFITQALKGEPLTVHDGGLQTRDWLHVRDHVRAIEKLVEADIDDVRGETINLGTGKETSILTIAKRILDILKLPVDITPHKHRRPGQVRRHVASTDKAKRLLRWQAETAFEDGLEETVRWYLENKDWWLGNKTRFETGKKEDIGL